MATGDAPNQHPPDKRVAPTAPDIGPLQSQAARVAVAQTVAAARGGLRLWRSPLAAAARRSSQSLAANLQPVAVQALRRGVDGALASPLPETLAGALAEHDVLERMAAVLLKGDTLEHMLDIAEREQVVKRLIAHSLTESLVTELRASEEVGRVVAALVAGDQSVDAAGAQPADPGGGLTEKVGRAAGNTLERIGRTILPGPDQPAPPAEPTGTDAQPAGR